MSSSSPVRMVVLASGSGSNFQALLDAVSTQRLRDAEIVRLFVNRKGAYAHTRADQAGVPAEYFNMVTGGFQPNGETDPARLREARRRYDAVLADKVLQCRPDLVVLAGWMHVFTEAFLVPVAERGVRVINLHPALPGTSVLSQVFFGSLMRRLPTTPPAAVCLRLLTHVPLPRRQANTTAPAPLSAPTKISRRARSRTTGRAS